MYFLIRKKKRSFDILENKINHTKISYSKIQNEKREK